jgi:hypothetical protein
MDRTHLLLLITGATVMIGVTERPLSTISELRALVATTVAAEKSSAISTFVRCYLRRGSLPSCWGWLWCFGR